MRPTSLIVSAVLFAVALVGSAPRALAPSGTPTDPSGAGAANPDPVTAGGSTLLTVAVTPGADPTSTGLSVFGDLSSIGGSAAQIFYDDGSHGDVTAGDDIFSFLAAIPPTTGAGATSLPITITDAQARSGSTAIPLTVQPPAATPAPVTISQIYGGGGNSGATLTHDFIELYNRSGSPVSITGWSVQYASSIGTTWLVTPLSGSLAPGQYYLIQQAQGTGGTTPLPTPDATGTTSMSATTGKVALVSNSTALSGSCPTASLIVDFVGYGTASCFEGAGPAPTLSNTTAALRAGGGATDTNNNAADFVADVPNPRNSAQVDQAPTVVATSPANGATNVALDANLTITFSEPVNVSGAWFRISCSASGNHTAAASGGPTSYTINPDTDFVHGESCTVTVFAAGVTDQDTDDPPDNMAADFVFSFTTEPVNVCTLAYTPIYAIQGSGSSAAITGPVTTQGVVVGDYEGPSPTLRGFYLQDLTGDGDPSTSDGIFVFNGNSNDVNLGDVVRVSGTAGELQDQTQISGVTSIAHCGTGAVAPADVLLPAPSASYLEQFEGMLVRFPQTLYVTEHFQLGRFGQLVMSSGSRLAQPTQVAAPGAPALALQAANNLNRIIVDDDLQNQNPDPIHFGRGGNPLSASNTLRGGDTATGMVGVLTYTWAGSAASGNAYRLRPLTALGGGAPNFAPANARPASPTPVGGTLRVAGMSLFNFFNTFDGLPDVVDNCTNGVGGTPADCRGADTQSEFDRQWPKTVAATLAINPDVLGVNEVENDGYGPDSAIQFLVNQLNAATAPGTYAFVDFDAASGQINALGIDAIKVGLIYNPASVTPVGTTAVLNSAAFVNGGDPAPRNRATFAQAFEQPSGARFILSVNHLKSRGSSCSAPDAGDGQGNCNIVRTNAANALAAWLASDPTGTGDGDVLILGDLNAYAKEDPLTALQNAGYTDLVSSFLGTNSYSFVFDGQWGTLDHALASASLAGQVAGVAHYQINADEPSVLDYNTDFKSAGQIVSLFSPDAYRSSDHDPVIVGLNLNAPPTVSAGGPYAVGESSSLAVSATGTDPDGDTLTYAWDLDDNGSFETSGQTVTFSAAGLDGPGSHTIRVRATDSGGLSAVASTTVNVLNVAPTVSVPSLTPSPATEGNAVVAQAAFSDPAPSDSPFSCTVDYGDGSGAQAGTINGSSCTGPSHTYADSGSYIATIAVTDKDGGTGTESLVHSVGNAAPGLSTTPSTQNVQYSDPIASVTITGTDVAADIPLSIVTEWKFNSGTFATGLPAWLALSSATCSTTSCSWTLSGTALGAPGTYTVRATVSDKDGGATTRDITIVVGCEDARTTYTGALFVSTSSTTSASAMASLSATVQDISATPDAAGDTYPGDIRNATVTFINRDTNTPIPGCTNLPVALVSPGDQRTGTVACTWNLTISGDAQDFTVGTIVENYYTRNASDDNVVVMVAKPLTSNFITGGGFVVVSGSAGSYAGDSGRKLNFGFNVKYNKKGTNLQGNINVLVRRTEASGLRVYQIKGNAMTSLAVQTGPGTATFNGKANIADVTDPLAPIPVEGNASLQVTMDDNGEPGTRDTIGITVFDRNGALLFSSKWNGVRTVEQPLNGGNLVVR